MNITRGTVGTMATIVVTDILGQQITSVTTTDSSVTIPVHISGIYLVREQEANGPETEKKVFVK